MSRRRWRGDFEGLRGGIGVDRLPSRCCRAVVCRLCWLCSGADRGPCGWMGDGRLAPSAGAQGMGQSRSQAAACGADAEGLGSIRVSVQ